MEGTCRGVGCIGRLYPACVARLDSIVSILVSALSCANGSGLRMGDCWVVAVLFNAP